MSKYIDKGTARQHLTDRLMESAINNFRVRAYVDDVYVDIIDNRLPVWLDELPTYDVAEVRHGRWVETTVPELWECSVCGCVIYSETEIDRKIYHKWCSRCGTKMDECEVVSETGTPPEWGDRSWAFKGGAKMDEVSEDE